MVTRDDKIVDFPNSEERARRLKVEVERLARQSPAEWHFWLDDSAKKYGIEPGKLKKMIEATIKANEKAQRAQKAEEQRPRSVPRSSGLTRVKSRNISSVSSDVRRRRPIKRLRSRSTSEK